MTQQDWKARQENLLDLSEPDATESIEEKIIALFEQLPLSRQEAVLEELTQIWDLDEESDDQ